MTVNIVFLNYQYLDKMYCKRKVDTRLDICIQNYDTVTKLNFEMIIIRLTLTRFALTVEYPAWIALCLCEHM